MRWKIWVLILGLGLLAACQAFDMSATETLVATETKIVQRTETLTPTATARILWTQLTPNFTVTPTETQIPTATPQPTSTPTKPIFVREGTPIPPSEPITAENAGHLVELARLGKGRIVDVQLSPDRNYLLVQTTIGVYGYLADSQEEVWRFEDPSGIAAMAVPRLERWMAVATNDGQIALLIYRRGTMFTRWDTGYDEITGLAFSYQDDLLAATGNRGVTVWEVGQTESLYRHPHIRGDEVRFTPDTESLTIFNGNELIYYSLVEGNQSATSLVTNPNTYSADRQLVTNGFSIWNVSDGEKIIDLERLENEFPTTIAAFSQNGLYVAVAMGYEGNLSVGIWAVNSGKFISKLRPSLEESGLENTRKLTAPVKMSGPDLTYSKIGFSPDGNILAAYHPSGLFDFWNPETNIFIYRYFTSDENMIFRNSSRLVMWSEEELIQINPTNGNLTDSTRDFNAGRRLTFSLGGRWLFADWVVWDMETLTRAYRFGDEIVTAISPEGDTIFAYQPEEHVFYRRRLDGFGLVEEIPLSWDIYDTNIDSYVSEWVIAPFIFAISPSGKYVSVNAYHYGLQTWNTVENRIVPELSNINSYLFHYSPDGKFFAVLSDSPDYGVKIFKLEPEIKNVDLSRSQSLCGFSLDGTRLLMRNSNIWYMRILDEDGSLTGSLPINVDIDDSSCPAFSPDNKILAINNDGEIKFVNLETGQVIVRISGINVYSSSILFSPDGRYIATSSWDGTIRIWGIPAEE